jgi:hypothetical protein
VLGRFVFEKERKRNDGRSKRLPPQQTRLKPKTKTKGKGKGS